MAKENTETPMVSMSAEAFQKMLEHIVQTQAENTERLIKELRKPNEIEQKKIDTDLEKRKKEKAYWHQLESEAKQRKEYLQSIACRHIHPANQKSHFFKMEVSFPAGAMMMVCSRCQKKLTNYDPENGKLILNEEFERWYRIPSQAENSI